MIVVRNITDKMHEDELKELIYSYYDEKEKLDNLAKLEKKYCLKPKEEELLIVRVSSKGGDYFK